MRRVRPRVGKPGGTPQPSRHLQRDARGVGHLPLRVAITRAEEPAGGRDHGQVGSRVHELLDGRTEPEEVLDEREALGGQLAVRVVDPERGQLLRRVFHVRTLPTAPKAVPPSG